MLLSCTDRQRSQRAAVHWKGLVRSSSMKTSLLLKAIKSLKQRESVTVEMTHKHKILSILYSDLHAISLLQWLWVGCKNMQVTEVCRIKLKISNCTRHWWGSRTELCCELEEDEAECLLKFMKHAESHTYHKHGLGYAIWEKGRTEDITTICSNIQQPEPNLM